MQSLTFSWPVTSGAQYRETLQELDAFDWLVVRRCLPYGRIYLDLAGSIFPIREGDVFDVSLITMGHLIVRDIPDSGIPIGSTSYVYPMVHEAAGDFVELVGGSCPETPPQRVGPAPAVPFNFYHEGAQDGLDLPWDAIELLGLTANADTAAQVFVFGEWGRAVEWTFSAAGADGWAPAAPIVVAREGGVQVWLEAAAGVVAGAIYIRPSGGAL